MSNIHKVTIAIDKYQKGLDKKCEKFVEELCKVGVQHANEEIDVLQNQYNSYSSLQYTKLSTREEHNGKKGTILNNYVLAPYIEFGTGVKGQNVSHPLANEIGWQASGRGWWYPSRIDDPNTTKREIIRDGKPTGEYVAYTQGMESRPFMHNTAMYLKEHCREIAKDIFND